MNIYQRVNEVRKAIGYVKKDKDVGFGKSSYKAVTHDAVTGMVRSALIEHGVVIVPSVLSATFHPAELVTSIGDDGKERTAHAKQRLYEAMYQVDFINIDDPTDRIPMQVSAHALDNGDKAPGKAMSYATKTAILKMFNIETGEDDESRFNSEEFDVLPHLDAILACQSMSDLKTTYEKSYKLAEDIKNKDAMKAIIAAKDKTKSIINEKTKALLDKEMAGQA